MSAICVLTPVVISSWPAITAAVAAAAASMRFSILGPALHEEEMSHTRTVETEIEDSEIVADGLATGRKIVIQRDDVTIEFGPDERGRCVACVTGRGHADRELRRIGQEVAGRVVQQFAYHKLISELRQRNYTVVDEQVLADESVQVRVRL